MASVVNSTKSKDAYTNSFNTQRKSKYFPKHFQNLRINTKTRQGHHKKVNLQKNIHYMYMQKFLTKH